MKWIADTDTTLFPALEKMAPESSKNTFRSWIKSGRIVVNGIKARTGHFKIQKGDEVVLQSKTQRVESGVRILYDDAHLAVIYKPAGLLSVSTPFETLDTAYKCLAEHYAPQRVYVVHRIDQETSGIMLFARSEEAFEKLKGIFEAHEIQREYWAVVEGTPHPQEGTWQSYLHEDPNYFVWSSDDPRRGKIATTHYTVMASQGGHSLLRLYLETGRKHQIRVHCKVAGHPVAGDKRYGSKLNPLMRMGLHARSLGFNHPITGKKMYFETPLPPVFLRCVPYRM